jgi:hypothetical protein
MNAKIDSIASKYGIPVGEQSLRITVIEKKS